MPIFEYQCKACGRVSSFLVRNVAGHRPPACPKCGAEKMQRVLSRFAAPKRRGEPATGDTDRAGDESSPPGMDRLMAEAEGLDENDPRAMGRFMRKMADEAGEPMPPEMNEFVRRLEAGEDPDKIEEDMGDVLGEEDSGGGDDDTLYDA